MAKGSRLTRAVSYFREADADEARVAFQLVREVMEERLKDRVAKAPVKRRKRKSEAADAVHKVDTRSDAGKGDEHVGGASKAAD